ncbi:14-3-3 protein-domain-containing protein [Favolaschia claudopus]|uniref:14-3-3 protein-domain-containing protein n=1 Tax=Favolaschia claudopus TaxID=2862362 RepID=A0AAW0A930_9AGAR
MPAKRPSRFAQTLYYPKTRQKSVERTYLWTPSPKQYTQLMPGPCDDHVYLAKVFEQAGRYEDMVASMNSVASFDCELSVEQRSLLVAAYSNVIGAHRASWRTICSIEQKQESIGPSMRLIQSYRETIEEEFDKGLRKHLIPSSVSSESLIIYHTMMANHWRYLAEITKGDRQKVNTRKSLSSYKAASDVAVSDLCPTHPLRIRLGRSLYIRYYEHLDSWGPGKTSASLYALSRQIHQPDGRAIESCE